MFKHWVGFSPFVTQLMSKFRRKTCEVTNGSAIVILFRQDMHQEPKLWWLIVDLICPCFQLMTPQKMAQNKHCNCFLNMSCPRKRGFLTIRFLTSRIYSSISTTILLNRGSIYRVTRVKWGILQCPSIVQTASLMTRYEIGVRCHCNLFFTWLRIIKVSLGDCEYILLYCMRL